MDPRSQIVEALVDARHFAAQYGNEDLIEVVEGAIALAVAVVWPSFHEEVRGMMRLSAIVEKGGNVIAFPRSRVVRVVEG